MKCILIIDDNPDNMDLVKEILEEAQYETLGAGTAEEGITLLEQGARPHLILMDASLPKLNGFDATKRIKSAPALSQIPVVMLTAFGSKENRDRGLACGCDDFLTKPIVDEDAFLEVIRKCLGEEP